MLLSLLGVVGMLIAVPAATASPPEPLRLWFDAYLGTNTSVELRDVTTAPDGSTYAAGRALTGAGDTDVVLIKHRPDGARAWVRLHGSTAHRDEQGNAIATSAAGIVAVAGRGRNATGSWDAVVAAWSSSGSRLWVRRLAGGGGLDVGATDVIVTGAGSVYVTGKVPKAGDAEDLFVAKYSRNGTLLWKRTVSGSAGGWDGGNALALDGAGNVYAAGWLTQAASGRDAVLVKYRPDGSRVWLKMSNPSGTGGRDEWANGIAIRGAFVMIVGGAQDADGDTCGLVARYDTAGKRWWHQVVDSYGTTDAEYGRVGVDRYGHAVVAGWKDFDVAAGWDAIVTRFEPAGDADWTMLRRGAADGDDRTTGLAVTAEGTVYAGGYYDAGGTGLNAFAVRLTPGGSYVWLGTFDYSGSNDGAVALSLGAKAVCLAGVSGQSGLMVQYDRDTP